MMNELDQILKESKNFANMFSNYAVQECNQTSTYTWWPYCPGTHVILHEGSRLEKSYRIVRALMKVRILEIKTLNKFFEAIDEIQKVV